MDSKPRMDWFDGTVTEQPLKISSEVNQIADSSTDLKIQQPRAQVRKQRLMGFKQLEQMTQLEGTQLMLMVSNTRSAFYDLLEVSLKQDYYVLIMRIISKLCEDDFLENKVRIIRNICKTKLIDTMDGYLHDLPDTRIVEKRLNLFFWNDIERFIHNIIVFCDTVLYILGSDYVRKVATLLASVKECLEGLKEKHKERFSDDIQNYLLDVESKVITCFSTLHFVGSSGSQQSQPVECDNETSNRGIRCHPILPTLDDLFPTNPRGLEVNVINGAYKSVEHYIEVQFNLLREDYIGPLREGIKSYRANPCNNTFDGVRIHEDVKFLSMYVTGNKIGHLLSIDGHINKKHGCGARNNLSMTKRFMYGALLLFTNDNFETVICGTVVDSDIKLLRDGLIVVSLSNLAEHPSTLLGQRFMMIESEVYYEPYFQVLNALQDLNPHEFPMKEYIVDVQPHTKPPSYLTSDTIYLCSNSYCPDKFTIPVLQTDKWPDPGDLCLDESQYEAYKLGLTREFAVIQGPPGTGKTFIGLKIANTLLGNVNLVNTPMLIICYTNHALDQFGEGILKVTTDIVRVGGQSRSEALEPYTLASLRMRNKSKHGYVYHEKKQEIEILMSKMVDIQDGLEKCKKGLVAFHILKRFISARVANLVSKIKSGEDPLLTWLFADCDGVRESYFNEQNKNTEYEKWYDTPDDELKHDEHLGVATCFSSHDVDSEIESIKQSMKYVKDMHNDSEVKVMEEKFLVRIDTLMRREKYFKKRMVGDYAGHKCFTTTEKSDVNNLSANQRWAIYFEGVKNLKDYLYGTFSQLENEYKRISKQCDEVRMMMDREILRSAKVVAMTTTAAARLHRMLRSLKSPIVIVEEAAEVLESHIIVSLTKHCRHLILIGDHQQLRPMASHYKLAKEFFLEVSLFERMIRNGVHSRTLSVQHRMRPAVAQLISPSIYPLLHNHPSVETYPPVRGVTKNLYFIKHNQLENADIADSNSYRNVFEAEMILGLANYLMQQDYKPHELTILATYTGQMFLMREMSKTFKCLDSVKITVIDNYQGEENKIILLSLVRSNIEGKIGFLAVKNRICVALSRAREGFYMIGNMDLLQSQSALWRDINTCLEKQNAIGPSITLCCNSHPNKFSEVSTLADFSKVENGGCDEVCNAALSCGHYCKLHCHGYDRQHQQYACYEPCIRKICVGGHSCPLSCHEPCDLCSIKVFKRLSCGHEKQLPCFTNADDPDVVCMAMVQLVLPKCGHKVEKNCYLEVKKFKCSICRNPNKR